MDLGLKNKTALVAAASSGLGKAVAQRLAGEGAKVFICGRNQDTITQAAQDINATGIACDVTHPEDIQQLVKEIGVVDILVTNAGGPPPGTFGDISDKAWDDSFQLTFMSAVRLIRAVLPGMQQNKWGRIICMASTSVTQPIPYLITSNAMRAAVANMAKTVAEEIADQNITVNTVATGMFETERMNQLLAHRAKNSGKTSTEEKNTFNEKIPAGRFGHVDEFADVVTWLVSERASYITGALIPVDGGLTHSL